MSAINSAEKIETPAPALFGKLPIGALFAFNPQDIGGRHEYEKIAPGKLRNRHTGREFKQRANSLVWLVPAKSTEITP